MAYNLKELTNRPERFASGHRMCAGCGAAIAVRAVMRAVDPAHKAVVACATGCLEVSTCMYPYTSWNDSFIHSAFENTGASMSGVVAAYDALKKKNKLDEEYRFIAFGGDGSSYDIGFQSLSGAMERGTNMTYVCYDNEAYMNTGIQRSSSTPKYADTTTSAIGKDSEGKGQMKKDLTKIICDHRIAYAAQTTFIGNFKDIHEKAQKAVDKEGASFLNVLAPCPRGWRYDTAQIMDICKAAVETCIWPLYEYEDGRWTLSYRPKDKRPVEEYLRMQGRFKHLFKNGNEGLIDEVQREVDARWEELLNLCENG